MIGSGSIQGTLAMGMLMGLRNSPLMEMVVVLASMAVVSLGVFIWAACLRKTRRWRHHHHSTETIRPAPRQNGETSISADGHRSHRRRRMYRKHRPRNPTLAETRGLPPVRAESLRSQL